ncbi:MAG: magnesium protoporphyrin IX methyltransferase [Alphaproteobacteria bacterium]|nr:magnesium protoporphyrin IX methyltransferase [Alphaproteobacteria bacterium]
MPNLDYQRRRGQLEEYFDRTAMDAWKRLTSDVPVSGIRATVRAGRDRMRATLLAALPANLTGRRILDAGCGTGAMSIELARRGADVFAVDLSPNLIAIARERTPHDLRHGSIEYGVGDMLSASQGDYDHIVAMDSLIHYPAADMVRVLETFSSSARRSILFTFAPRTPALTVMHTVGRLFPRSNRAPAIEPVSNTGLRQRIDQSFDLGPWRPAMSARITSGFYMSHAMELVRR